MGRRPSRENLVLDMYGLILYKIIHKNCCIYPDNTSEIITEEEFKRLTPRKCFDGDCLTSFGVTSDVDDYCKFTENFLRGENYHSLADAPNKILKILRRKHLTDETMLDIYASICEELYESF